MSIQTIKKDYISGEKILVTGWYKFAGHVEKNNQECFVPPQSNRMFFKKDKTAPLLGSCEHIIKWELISAY